MRPTEGGAPRRAPRPAPMVHALWAFGRPHTLVGTSVSVVGLFVIALTGRPAAPIGPASVRMWESVFGDPGMWALPLAATWGAALAANLFIVGLNQITDVSIDRINKPHLPLASGAITGRQARIAVGFSAVLALLLGAIVGPILVVTVGAGMAVGAAYSLPPLRLKRHALWAAASIAAVRGAIVNVGVYLAFRQALGLPLAVSPAVWALTAFVVGFAVAIALAKDVPDAAGDRRHGIGSLTVRWGRRKAWQAARAVLAACYVAIIVVALTAGIPGTSRAWIVGGHAALLALLWGGTRATDPTSASSIGDGYRLVWRLFYAEYLLFPVACLAATSVS